MTDRPLPEHHEGLLKVALKLEESANIPQEVVDLYWDAERTARRMGHHIGGTELVLICLLANRATPPDPVSFLDENAKLGDRVLAKHRRDWRWGTFKAKAGKKIIVQLDDDTGEDREFNPTAVRFPTREELSLIGV